jgi:hypothetical protein
MSEPLKAPYPYFGGKKTVAHLIWRHLGDVQNLKNAACMPIGRNWQMPTVEGVVSMLTTMQVLVPSAAPGSWTGLAGCGTDCVASAFAVAIGCVCAIRNPSRPAWG